jgi:hypothetical protein
MSQIHAHRFCLGGPSSVHVQNPYKNASMIPYIIESKGWLPGMDSNHELDTLLKSRNLLILQSH